MGEQLSRVEMIIQDARQPTNLMNSNNNKATTTKNQHPHH